MPDFAAGKKPQLTLRLQPKRVVSGAPKLTGATYEQLSLINERDLWASDTDGDGLPDAWETKYGLDAFSPHGVNGADADADNDISNLDEFLAGTNPQNADNTPPTITATVTPPPNAAGWNTNDVVVHFTASDAGSGVETLLALDERGRSVGTPDGNGGVYVSFATETNAAVIGLAVDAAGNQATTVVTVHMDKTPPVILLIPSEGETNHLNEAALIVECYDVAGSDSNAVPSGLNLESLRITLDGEDVTTNFFRFERGAVAAATNLEVGAHTWSVIVADQAGYVTTNAASFYASGETDPEAPEIKREGLGDGVNRRPDNAEQWLMGTVRGPSGTVVYASVNGEPLMEMNLIEPAEEPSGYGRMSSPVISYPEYRWGGLIRLKPGTNTGIVLAGSPCPVRDQFPGGWTNVICRPSFHVVNLDRSSFRVEVPALNQFFTTPTQQINGVISWADESGWPWGTEIVSVTLLVGGVSVPVTWTADGGSLSFSAEVLTPCAPLPVVLSIRWVEGFSLDIPLGFLEGYEIVRRLTRQSDGGYQFRPHNSCEQPRKRYDRWQGWEATQFEMPCNGNLSNYFRETFATPNAYECVSQKPALPPIDQPWGPVSVTNYFQEGSERGLEFTEDFLLLEGEWELYNFYYTDGSIRFRAPMKYEKGTRVLFTLEGVYCSTNVDLVKFWGQAPTAIWTNGGSCDLSYMVTVDGGKQYTMDKDSFEWPATFQAWDGGYLYDHRLSFSGFHNGAPCVGKPKGLNVEVTHDPRWCKVCDGKGGFLNIHSASDVCKELQDTDAFNVAYTQATGGNPVDSYGFVACWNNNPPVACVRKTVFPSGTAEGVFECFNKHEQNHIDTGVICPDPKCGLGFGVPSNLTLKESECSAWKVTLQCLQSLPDSTPDKQKWIGKANQALREIYHCPMP